MGFGIVEAIIQFVNILILIAVPAWIFLKLSSIDKSLKELLRRTEN